MVFSAKLMLRPRLYHATCANSNREHGYILMDRQVLRANQNKNIIHHLNGNLCKLHADADCASNWDKIIAADDPNTAHSWPHYMLTYHDILLLWASHNLSLSLLQSITRLNMWGCQRQSNLPVLRLLEVMQQRRCPINSDAISLATNLNYCSRKHQPKIALLPFTHWLSSVCPLCQDIGPDC